MSPGRTDRPGRPLSIEMIRIPKFSKDTKTRIPFASIFVSREFLESFIVKTAKTYLDLGGPHSLSWPVTTGLDEVAVGVDEALDRYLMNSIARSELARDMIANYRIVPCFHGLRGRRIRKP